MTTHHAYLRHVSQAVALSALFAFSAAAQAESDVSFTDAKIESGRLTVTGKAATAGMRLRLDGKTGNGFTVVSGPDRSFKFSLVYLPKDCIADVQRVMPGAKLGQSNEAVIANCAPAGMAARGAWSAKLAYESNDLVSFRGASWLARRDNAGVKPSEGPEWQLFAAKGDAGDAGEAGNAATGAAPLLAGGTGVAQAAAGDSAGTAVPDSPAVPSGPAGGDLTGTYPNPAIRNVSVTAAKIAPGAVVTTRIADSSVITSKIGNLAVTTPKIGTAAVTTAKLGDAAVTTPKLAANAVIAGKIADGAVVETKIADGAVTSAKVLDGSLIGADIAPESITSTELGVDSVQATEIADNSIDSGEIVDFGLSNEDVGVLFAQVNADATIFSSSGGVTGVSLGTGTYEIDFGRNISNCAVVATQGEGGIGGASGAIMGVTDRSGNANAYFVTSRDAAGALTNTAFQLVAVC